VTEQTEATTSETREDLPSPERRAQYQRMILNEAWLSLAFLAVVIGLVARRDGLIIFGATLLVVSLVARLWSHFSLHGVSYQRSLNPRRAFIGETVELTITIENRKLLPVGWVRIDDEWPEGLCLVDSEDIHPSAVTGRDVLRNAFSLQWYERVRRHYQIQCTARGYYRLGPMRAVSGDIFGMYRTDHRFFDFDWLIVYPRVLPIEELGLPPKDPLGETTARQRIFEDPSRTIGVRDHQPEDDFRRVHWKATARKQELQVKVYEPTTSFAIVTFLNVATFDKYWLGTIPELLERAITVAASICSYAYERRYVVGLIANGSIPRSDQPLRVLPGRDPQQLTRVLQALAAVTPIATRDIAELLTEESPRLPWGATLIVVTAHVNEELESVILRLHAAGRRLVLVSLSPDPPNPLIAQEILTYHLPDAASAYIPLPSGAANRVTPAARREAVLAAWAGLPESESAPT
jgi:uncharacterized protein (DUF58 family)